VSDNQVTLTGNLTDDPELRFTPGGVAVASFRLAVDQRVWDSDGWKDGQSSYFRVNVWRDQAEHLSRSAHKGARCVVVGRLRSRSWETPEGQRRSAVEVDAEEVGMSLRFGPLDPPPADAASQRPAPAKAGGNGSRRGRQPAKAATAGDEAPF
jgi:single-strand DNA-binding protein